MKIFKAEIENGLEQKILSEVSLAYHVPINKVEEQKIPEIVVAKDLFVGAAKHNKFFYDIYGVIASSNWNLNDDIILPIELFRAKKSVRGGMITFAHRETDIIGSLEAAVCVNEKFEVLAEDIDEGELPELFHLVSKGFIYRYWRDAANKQRIEDIIAEIEDNKQFLSFEGVISGFDYGVMLKDGTQHVIARNEDSAFLSKHLRVYGGTGKYEDAKLGRVLRGLTFIGQGVVSKPANIHGSIFNDISKFQGVFSSISVLDNKKEEVIVMAGEADKNLEKVEAELASVKEDLTKVNVELTKVSAEKDALVKSKETLEGTVASLTEELNKTKDTVKELTVKASKAEEDVKAAQAELSKVKAEAVKVERVGKLVEAGKSKEDADVLAVKFSNLNDEQFSEIVALAKVSKTEKTAEEVEEEVIESAEEEVEASLSTEETVVASEEDRKEVVEFLKKQRKGR